MTLLHKLEVLTAFSQLTGHLKGSKKGKAVSFPDKLTNKDLYD